MKMIAKREEDPLAEQLAAFTDRLLNNPESPPSVQVEDAELRRLQETVLHLHTTLGSSDLQTAIPESLSRRLNERLKAAWEEAHPIQREGGKQPNWLERLRQLVFPPGQGWRSAQQRRRLQVLRLSLASAAILLLLTLILPGVGSSLPSAAMGEAPLLILLLIALGMILIILWLWRGKAG